MKIEDVYKRQVWQGIDWLREKKYAKGIGAIAAVLCWPYVVVEMCIRDRIDPFSAAVNTISNPPGEYDRKVETQRN